MNHLSVMQLHIACVLFLAAMCAGPTTSASSAAVLREYSYVRSSTFALKGDGSGGTIIDSGTSLTSFPDAVFESIRKTFVSQLPLPIDEGSNGLLCFDTPPKKAAPAVPKLILHLEGMDWDLPRENYVLEGDDEDGTGGGLCLVIRSSGENNPMTTIGNFQQQNMHIVYDLQADKLDVVPARCDKL